MNEFDVKCEHIIFEREKDIISEKLKLVDDATFKLISELKYFLGDNREKIIQAGASDESIALSTGQSFFGSLVMCSYENMNEKHRHQFITSIQQSVNEMIKAISMHVREKKLN